MEIIFTVDAVYQYSSGVVGR